MARTLDEIKGRCRIVEIGNGKEHWIWTGATNGSHMECIVRAPDWGRDPTGKTTYNMSVQRAIHMVTKKTPVRKGLQFFRTCHESGCVSPDCTSMTTKKRAGIHISRRFKQDRTIQENLSSGALRGWDKKGRKVSDEKVLQIYLETGLSDKEIAAKHDVDATTVAKYRRGELRKQVTLPTLGMFSGLLR